MRAELEIRTPRLYKIEGGLPRVRCSGDALYSSNRRRSKSPPNSPPMIIPIAPRCPEIRTRARGSGRRKATAPIRRPRRQTTPRTRQTLGWRYDSTAIRAHLQVLAAALNCKLYALSHRLRRPKWQEQGREQGAPRCADLAPKPASTQANGPAPWAGVPGGALSSPLNDNCARRDRPIPRPPSIRGDIWPDAGDIVDNEIAGRGRRNSQHLPRRPHL